MHVSSHRIRADTEIIHMETVRHGRCALSIFLAPRDRGGKGIVQIEEVDHVVLKVRSEIRIPHQLRVFVITLSCKK